MNVITTKNMLKNVISTLAVSAMLLPAVTLAESDHGHSNMKAHSNMMDHNTREVMGTGRINKVMADRHMVNIVHDPIAELEWPKMRMNFKTTDEVNLDALKPGQEVTFKLQVKKDNSYVIKQIDVK